VLVSGNWDVRIFVTRMHDAVMFKVTWDCNWSTSETMVDSVGAILVMCSGRGSSVIVYIGRGDREVNVRIELTESMRA
jgi:hypothetical protein